MISVVMATYNGIKFIEDQLDSIVNQTKIPDEIIIQDDLSIDGTYEFVLEYSKKYPKIKWKINKNSENLGYKKNFYTAICNTRADYIFLCDQDDIWKKYKIEKMIDIMEKNDNILLLMSNLQSFYQENCKNNIHEEFCGLKKLVHFKNLNHCVNTPRPGCSFCMRRELIEEYKANVNVNVPHDNLIWQFALLKRKAYLFNEVTMKYRRHSSNASNNQKNSKEKRLNSIKQQIDDIKFLEKYCKEEVNKKFFEEQEKVFMKRYEAVRQNNLLGCFKLLLKIKYYYTIRLWIVDLYYNLMDRR